jgi:hypothetical protein
MHEHTTPDPYQKHSDLRPLWAITWRSSVLIPFVLVFGVGLLVIAVSLVVLPICAAVYAYHHVWQPAVVYFVAWLVLCLIWRIFRLGRFFEWPPSVL